MSVVILTLTFLYLEDVGHIRIKVRVRLGVRVRVRVRARRLEDVGQLVEAVEHVLQQLHHDPRLDGGRGSRVVEDR